MTALAAAVGFWALAWPVSAGVITPEAVISLVNESRMGNGLDVLVPNADLSRAAKEKADDMFRNDYFAHTSPQGLTPWHWIEEAGYGYHYAGENLAMNFTDAEKQHRAWLESASHRKNILNPNFSEIGIGVKKGTINGRETIVVVQMFAAPFGTAASLPAVEKIKGEEKTVIEIASEKAVPEVAVRETSPAVSSSPAPRYPAVMAAGIVLGVLLLAVTINIAIIFQSLRRFPAFSTI